jgi:hypothetical protein
VRNKNLYNVSYSNVIIWGQINIEVAVTDVTDCIIGLTGLRWLENCSVITLSFPIASEVNWLLTSSISVCWCA